MFDVTKFNNRNGWTIKDLARRLFDKGGESRVGMWSSGDSNPRYEAILKLINLGATAEELFGKDYADKLLANSFAMLQPPPEFANDPEHAAGLNQGLKDIEAKIEARVLAKLKERGLAPIPPGSDNVHIDLQDPKFQELVEKALIRIEERKKQGIIK